MSTPYWGRLPPPQVRRLSGGSDQPDRRQSLDHSSLIQPRYDSNRASGQTTITDAHTDSTYSPFASPTASNAPGGGLTPRPPSLSYSQKQHLPEPLENRRTWRNRDQNDGIYESPDTLLPPAAPDVPKAPPISYKSPHGSGGSSYTYTPTAQPRPSHPSRRLEHQDRIGGMETESFYKDATPSPERQSREPALDQAHRDFDHGVVSPEHLERELVRSGSIRRPPNGYRTDRRDPNPPKRRDSLGPEPHDKMWAADRSPLQKLELTLDGITKEEKRARVEAAERRARERAARVSEAAGATEHSRPLPTQQSRPRDKGQSATGDQSRYAPTADPGQASQRHGPSGQSPRSQMSVPKNRGVLVTATTDGAPRRNLSFRDRAAAQERSLPQEPDVNPPHTTQNAASGRDFGLTRSGSNKLKKNPPGDPWYTPRKEAEDMSTPYNKPKPADGDDVAGAQPSYHSANYAATRTTGETAKIMSPSIEDLPRPPARGKTFGEEKYDEEERPSRMRGLAAAIGFGRSNSLSTNRRPSLSNPSQNPPVLSGQHTQRISLGGPPNRRDEGAPSVEPGRANQTIQKRQAPALTGAFQAGQPSDRGTKSVKFQDREHGSETFDDDMSDTTHHRRRLREYLHHDGAKPGQGTFRAPTYLDEWKQSTVGTLSGSLLDLTQDPAQPRDLNAAWWEPKSKRRTSSFAQPHIGAFDSGKDDTQARTAFKPPLYLKCGPLLRYCGMGVDRPIGDNTPGDKTPENKTSEDKKLWRGSVMIVTQDSDSSYDTVPTLRLFAQPIELLPPPPAEVQGEQPLLPEYVDPIAGLPKVGHRGETLYVRPVDQLEEAKDLSMVEPDDGLFELTRSIPEDYANSSDPPDSFPSRKKRTEIDGETLGKYRDVCGFRLHAERGHTFWRFNIEVELREKQQRIAYRINSGPPIGFWVPGRDESMNIMFHSCNGFSQSVNPDDFSGPDPMWRDVLNVHQTRPFHVMVGGGDQVYNDVVAHKAKLFREWIAIKNPLHKSNAPFTAGMQEELEAFYMERYMLWFSQGLFGLASSQIPMVNMYDDHDIIDGFGSYPHHFMKSPVFSGLGNVAFKYYMLFQHQSTPDETEESEPSWCLGVKPGPYITQRSRSLFVSLGARVSLLAVDTRAERTREEVVHVDTWKKLMDRCYDEIDKDKTHHLLVLLGVPIAYPRLVWLENILTSRLMDPVKALGKFGLLGNFVNSFDGGVEVLDDLDDHWTAKNHKHERTVVVEDLQDLAVDKSLRVTILSGDVHLAAVGQFYSNPKLRIPKHKDYRYMLNVVSSAIANTPPPDLMADVLNKRNKIHHFDKETDENMMPLFGHGVDGKPRNNKHLLPHRNWCSIREYVPGHTPPPTPPPEDDEYAPEVTPPTSRGGLFRRFSLSKDRGPALRPDVPKDPTDRSRPPLSGGFMRSFSRRGSSSDDLGRPRSSGLMRTFSLGSRPRSLFGRDSKVQPDDGGINGSWGQDDDDEDVFTDPTSAPPPRASGNTLGLRGGAGNEYEVGDEAQFTTRPPPRAFTLPMQTAVRNQQNFNDSNEGPPIRPFRRTPTGLSSKKLTKHGPEHYEVDAEGGLEVCLNVEVNPKDPTGITVPYRLLVPRLWYEDQEELLGLESEAEFDNINQTSQGQEEFEDEYDEENTAEHPHKKVGVFRRWLSTRGKDNRREVHEDDDEWDHY
ncbi:hypothetical protein SAMD00023353_0701460 [Rosellinia necatrix]|uniref:PhoD-like phosphatase domain-containing protein n=1 Tax=Rosellinia necatrix TaxID=77044 RepID=A0A1S7UQ55_ROSNE|nr:hypothetical protein SAMD00023353_0701460 [Rosellinia necatrix]